MRHRKGRVIRTIVEVSNSKKDKPDKLAVWVKDKNKSKYK